MLGFKRKAQEKRDRDLKLLRREESWPRRNRLALQHRTKTDQGKPVQGYLTDLIPCTVHLGNVEETLSIPLFNPLAWLGNVIVYDTPEDILEEWEVND